MMNENITFGRLEDQIDWYDNKSIKNQRVYKILKGIELVSAALIPFLSLTEVHTYVIGILGLIIIVMEGLQNLNQYQKNWLSYRTT